MDEARRVLDRLTRIEILEREGAQPQHLLAEVRALLREAEAWVARERAGAELAAHTLDRCRDALAQERASVTM